MFAEIEKNGFAVLKCALTTETIRSLTEYVSKIKISGTAGRNKKSLYGVRNLLDLSPEIREFSESATVKSIAEKFAGENAKVVRAIFFDKTPDANWKVPWHQDLTISVKAKRETEGFTPWTMKAGIQHVQPPVGTLEKMLALRFHLDDADETNGALKIVPKSHKHGRLTAGQIKNMRGANESVVCRVKQGDCLIMRPLVLHSSSAGTNPKRRRVIHLEFAACDLPNGLEFYGS